MDYSILDNAILVCPDSSLLKENGNLFSSLSYEGLLKLFAPSINEDASLYIKKESPNPLAESFCLLLLDKKEYQSQRLNRLASFLISSRPRNKDYFKGHNVVYSQYSSTYGIYFAFLLQEVPNLSSSYLYPPLEPKADSSTLKEAEAAFYAYFNGEEIKEIGFPSLEKYKKRVKEEALLSQNQAK